MRGWGTAQRLFDFISVNMPADAPGSLSPTKALRVTIYLLVESNLIQSDELIDESKLDDVNLISTTSTLSLEGAPLLPHPMTIGFENCFICHPIPSGHVGREQMEDVCQECHAEGPQILTDPMDLPK
jgi:hypothetical protein